MELSVSILNAKDKKQTIQKLNCTRIKYYHIDIMDGRFVSSKFLPFKELEELSKLSNKKLDVHLMVEDPEEYIDKVKNLNIEYLTIHLEINKNINLLIQQIKKLNFKVGISIKPTTPVDKLKPYLKDIDLILIMSVEPGLGGQPFLESSLKKIEEIKKLIKNYPNIKLSVDGGINDKTITKVKDIDIAVVGSFITKSNDQVEQINKLLV